MTTTSSAIDDPVPAAPPRAARRWPAWTREPLLHFVAVGAMLFGADHLLIARDDDPRTIVVGTAVDKEARDVFKSARGREPDARELAALRQAWLDNEVLYREGLALRVDRGDTAIRERVIFKALSIVDSNLRLPAFDDRTLRTWFEAHRDKYDEPARYDFQEAVLTEQNTESAVRAFVAELNANPSGDARASLRVFKGRPHANLVQGYGDAFAGSLEALPPAEWHALETRGGWRAVRLDAITPARPARFEAIRAVVQQDWTDATMAEQRTAAVRSLARKYTVKADGDAR